MVLNGKNIVPKLDEDFIKCHDENSSKGYILKVEVETQKNLLDLHVDLLVLSERKKIKECNKLVSNTDDK